MPFQPGQSGNPAGRAPGSKNKWTLFNEALLEGEAYTIMRNVIRQAVDGDPWAIRVCLDRLAPRLRSRSNPLTFDLPNIKNAGDGFAALSALSEAIGAGELSADEADRVVGLVEHWVEAMGEIRFKAKCQGIKLDDGRKDSASASPERSQETGSE